MKPRIALVTDTDDWAFSNIARQLEKHLGNRFDFTTIPMSIIDNIVRVLLMAKDCQVIHFFWREDLRLIGTPDLRSYVEGLGISLDEFSRRFIKPKKITTGIYDHLLLEPSAVSERAHLYSDLLAGYSVASNKLRDIYQALPGYPAPAAVLEDGVDLGMFQPKNLERLDEIPRRGLVIGWVGNSGWAADLEDFKGVNSILRPAIECLRAEGFPVTSLFADRQTHNIPHREMPDYYAKIDVYVCASKIEGTPNPVLEAMACGIPIVTTDVGIVPQALGPLQRRFILEERSVGCLVEKLKTLLGEPALLRQMSAENLKYVARWDWSVKASAFGEFFDAMLAPDLPRGEFATGDARFAEFVEENLDRDAYLEAYPDVRAAGIDPVAHWLEHGMAEGRFVYPGSTVISGEFARRLDRTLWQHFTWRGRPVAVRVMKPVKATLVAQILAQARHDPAVLAAGATAVGGLRQLDGPDLLGRGGVDPHSIFAVIPERPDVIVVVPFLRGGSTDKYASDLVDSLSALARSKILVMVTDDTSETASGWESLAALAPLRAARVIFWRDICGPSHREPKFFARLMNALRPARLVAIDSQVGLDTVAGFGRALSQFAKLYCVYLGPSMKEGGSMAGARYPCRTLPHALALTDNAEMASILRRQWGELPGPGIAVLPPRLQLADGGVTSARVAARRKRVSQSDGQPRWAWASTLAPRERTAILAALSAMRPSEQFDLYEQAGEGLEELAAARTNIAIRGPLKDLASGDFSAYDGFLYAGHVEDPAVIVLEMSQHAVPMVVTDVGGLRDTFDDQSIEFVDGELGPRSLAEAYSDAMNRILALAPSDTAALVKSAHSHVAARHNAAVHLENVADIFGVARHV